MIGESVDVEINDEVIEIYKEIMKQSKVYQSKKQEGHEKFWTYW